MKVTLHDTAVTSVACMVDEQVKSAQAVRRTFLLKQLSSMRYLGRQGIGVRGHTDEESNLIQLLKTRAEDVPCLHQWIKEGKYLSHDIINELYEIMANTDCLNLVDIAKQFVEVNERRRSYFGNF